MRYGFVEALSRASLVTKSAGSSEASSDDDRVLSWLQQLR